VSLRLRLRREAAAPVTGRLDLVTVLLFAGCVLIAAGNFVAVRFSNQELAPLWGAGLRFGVAGASYAALVGLLRLPWVTPGHRRGAALYGLLSFAVFYAFMYWALLHVTAGTASIVIGAVPLVTLLLAVGQRLERLSARTLLGGSLALVGIGWLTVSSGAIAATPLAVGALAAAAVCLGQSLIVAKRVAGEHPAAVNALGMGIGAAVLLTTSLLAGETWRLPTQPAAVWAVVYLVTFGSMGLFGLSLLLIRRWSASASSYVLVVVPLVTLAIEAVVAGAPVTTAAVLGALLVLAGTWFGALQGAAAPRPG